MGYASVIVLDTLNGYHRLTQGVVDIDADAEDEAVFSRGEATGRFDEYAAKFAVIEHDVIWPFDCEAD